MKKLTFIIAILLAGTVFGQKQHFVDSAGKLYWNKEKPVYIFIADNPEGTDAKKLNSETTAKYANPVYLDTEGVNYIRTRDAVDPETKRVIPGKEVLFEVYADGLAPATRYSYDQKATYIKNGIQYFTEDVKLTLEARDELSGIESIKYAINGGEYQDYKDSLIFSDVSRYTIRFYSQDNVGNKEEVNEIRFSVDPTPPVTDLKINGLTEDSVISVESELFLVPQDSLSGVSKVYYKIDAKDYRQYRPKSKLPVSNLTEGSHTFSYYSVDFVGNQEEEKVVDLYLDRSPPILVADILGDRFIVGDQIYFSGRTKLKLTAVDNKVGVKEIKYAIDDEEFSPYTKPFYLPSVAGVHSIKYYAVDNLNNASYSEKQSNYMGQRSSQSGFEEFRHNVNKVYVDMTGPEVEYKIKNFNFKRGDTLYIGPYSLIELSASDSESGLKEIRYSLNDSLGENVYTGPFSFRQGGFNTLSVYGYDNVNNRNLGQFSFMCDVDEPEIFIKFNVGELGKRGDKSIYPSTAGVFLSASDEIAGVVSLKYKLDKDEEKNYTGLITNLSRGKHTLTVYATDALNNTKIEEVEFIVKDGD